MPANEQTWRSSKLMHTIFAVSAVLMLLATIWMMGDDNDRPWKEYQRKFNSLDLWSTQARITEQKSADYEKKLRELEQGVKDAQTHFTAEDRKAAKDFVQFDKDFTAEMSRLVKEDNRNFPVTRDPAADDQISKLADSLVDEVKQNDSEAVRKDRAKLLASMNDVIARYSFREDHFTLETKDKKADLSAAQSLFDLAVGENRPGQTLEERQKELKERQDLVTTDDRQAAISTGLTQKATSQRKEMERVRGIVTAEEDKAQKALSDHQFRVKQLTSSAEEHAMNFGKELVQLPVLDAFNSPLKISQVWLPELPWNNNFKQVDRFDRCTTCHLGMTKTQPGSAVDPAYPKAPSEPQEFLLATPAKAPTAEGADKATGDKAAGDAAGNGKPTLESVYGFTLAPRGALNASDVTIYAVYPRTLAASAGLMGGDIIVAVDGARVLKPDQVRQYLLESVAWGQPFTLSIRRGVPHPYASHPRLDLFLGNLSPHPVDKFGCSICHQGQGSETSFKWATHTPDDLIQARNWTREYEWFRNENWTWPMFPKRFVESGCLKCHHEVVDLEASAKYPEAPAPKLIAGYETIRRYGCFGCHEINGFAGADKRIGPDIRLEPNYYAAAEQLKNDPGLATLDHQAPKWADDVAEHDDAYARRRLFELVDADAKKATTARSDKKAPKPLLRADSHRLATVLKDVDLPGTQRKIGPSLRHVGSKLSYDFLVSWIANPQNFRPGTRMPRFFGLWDHLDGDGLAESRRFEPIEIRALAEYLLKTSQPFDYVEPPKGVKPVSELDKAGQSAAIVRGKKVFETRGCLACHQHVDFPQAKESQGPDLSRIGAKLQSNPRGRQWLYSWVRQPNRYHLRTFMPNLFLEPVKDAAGTMTDPADDVAEYLLTSQQGWKPEKKLPRQMTDDDEKALGDLALMYLSDKFSVETAARYLYDGIPVDEGFEVLGDESVIVNPELPTAKIAKAANVKAAEAAPADAPKEPAEHKQKRLARTMEYVGRRSIGKFGCFGCHDIPGYEDAKTIGTGLADWGRKDPSRLAFEEIIEYVTHHPEGLHPGGIPAANKSDAKPAAATTGSTAYPPLSVNPTPPPSKSAARKHAAAAEPAELSLDDLPNDIGFFMNELLEEDRTGFLWQKLRAPRSYDFRKTGERGYNVRLRMPQFTFAVEPRQNQEKIEQVMTFVLGLVSEPPPAAYLAKPDPDRAAIVAGRKVIEKFNCTGCHTLEMEQWQIRYKPGDYTPEAAEKKPGDHGKPAKVEEYDFDLPHFSSKEITDSKAIDRRGDSKAILIGMPLLSDRDGQPLRVDEDGAAIEAGDTTSKFYYQFMLFQNAVVDGQPQLIGPHNVRVAPEQIVHKYPPLGGDLARMLFPIVVGDEAKITPAVRSTDPAKPANQAWGWLPPPLVGEGRKVQTDWLHNFLMDPFPIRPAAVLRMPKFNMSSEEASTLVHYFAAHDGAEYPYEFDVRGREDHIEQMEATHPKYLEGGLAIVTDNNFCVKCHLIGDFSPGGNPKAMGPRLERVHNRLRPDYLQRWIGDPARVLPYTAMPVNIPPDKGVDQNLFPGSPQDQVNAVVDLLANFDRLAEGQMSIKARIKPAAPAPTTPPAAGGNTPAPAKAEKPEDKTSEKNGDTKTKEP
jgi:cytochrome c2